MNHEALNYYQTEIIDDDDANSEADLENDSELESSDFFDLDSFFDGDEDDEKEEGEENENGVIAPTAETAVVESDLLLTLRDDSNKSIATLTTKVTAESFALGAALTSGVFSTLSSIVGSCGVFCAHGLGSLAQAGSSGLGAAPGLGGLNMPNFNVDSQGNFRLDGNIDSLSQATGISKNKLLSGAFSAEDILVSLFASFGEGLSMACGFGLIDGIIDVLFDGLLPTTGADQQPVAA